MGEASFVRFVEEIDDIYKGYGDESKISPIENTWYRCMKTLPLVCLEKHGDSSLEELVSNFEEWYQLNKRSQMTDAEEDRKEELEAFANRVLAANEETMGCKTLWGTQKEMQELEQEFEGQIGYVDEKKKRKLKPEYFLSGEVAAYIILHSWNAQMGGGQIIASQDDLVTLECIRSLSEAVKNGVREDDMIRDLEYKGRSRFLWLKLIEEGEGKRGSVFNKVHQSIFELAISIKEEKGKASEADEFRINDDWGNPFKNSFSMVSAYEIVREYLKPLSRDDAINRVAQKGFDLVDMHIRHFNLF